MNTNSQRNQTIALAAVCQAAKLVCDVSKGKEINKDAELQLYKGIMVTSPNSVFDVYPNIEDLTDGTSVMLKQMSGKTDRADMEITRYIAGIMSLAKKLIQSNRTQQKLTEVISDVERRLEHFDINSDSVLSNFADGYSQAISPLGQKIQVMGDPNVLRQESSQNKIRALLLSGVRAGVLWRQMGGKRRQFIFNRKQLVQDIVLFHKELTLN